MKHINDFTTTVAHIEYSATHHCNRVYLEDAIYAVDDKTGHDYEGAPIEYIYPQFGDIDLTVGDTIKIDIYYHLEGDIQGDWMFERKGIHYFITKL